MEQGYKQKFYENYSHNVLPQMIAIEPYRKKQCLQVYMLATFVGLLFAMVCLIVIKIKI